MLNLQSKFITFEGCDGSGKSTQATMLADYIKATFPKLEVIFTKEPGATELGKCIRELLLGSFSSTTEVEATFLLYLADRVQHIKEVIAPALERGALVICDRYIDSTYAYQVGGKLLDKDFYTLVTRAVYIQTFLNYPKVSLHPNITFLLDIDPIVAKDRLSKRLGKLDAYDALDEDFYSRVRAAYKDLANEEKSRFTVIDADADPANIHQAILDKLEQQLNVRVQARLSFI
jgi:dTMP kinase